MRENAANKGPSASASLTFHRSMSTSSTHEIWVVSRLKGLPSPDGFTAALTDLHPLQDDIVLFRPLTLAELKRTVDLQPNLLSSRLAERHITIDLTDAAKERIAREAYDPVYGARPLKRFLQRQVETPLSRKLIAGQITDGDHVTMTLQAGELVFGPTALKKAA